MRGRKRKEERGRSDARFNVIRTVSIRQKERKSEENEGREAGNGNLRGIVDDWHGEPVPERERERERERESISILE